MLQQSARHSLGRSHLLKIKYCHLLCDIPKQKLAIFIEIQVFNTEKYTFASTKSAWSDFSLCTLHYRIQMENTPEKFNPLEKFKIQNQARFYFTVVKIARGRKKKLTFNKTTTFQISFSEAKLQFLWIQNLLYRLKVY